MLSYLLTELTNMPAATGLDGTETVPVVQGGVAKSVPVAQIPPRLTTTQRDALTLVEGLLIYNTTTHKLNVRTAAAWEVVTSA